MNNSIHTCITNFALYLIANKLKRYNCPLKVLLYTIQFAQLFYLHAFVEKVNIISTGKKYFNFFFCKILN